MGSAFLMATSAIGPGFITQTTVYTERLGTSFGFIILCSVVLDIVVQLNLWRVVAVSGYHAQDLANRVLRGSGHFLTALIVFGGLAFNIGNTGGAALGLNVMLGTDLWVGALVSAGIALFVFWYREAGRAMDTFARTMGAVMILLTTWIAFKSNPPLGDALVHTVVPQVVDTTAIIVLVGGTVGGYISFSGIHRLVDAGITGVKQLPAVSRTSVRAILIASLMRVVLFLAVLGVVTHGGVLDPDNPPASVFRLAAGEAGYRIFGLVLWCASITSVVGSAYTSVSFLKGVIPNWEQRRRVLITGFILFSAGVFVIVGRPVHILILAGALNGFVLPVALGLILLAIRKPALMGEYRHPLWMAIAGWMVCLMLLALCIRTFYTDLSALWPW